METELVEMPKGLIEDLKRMVQEMPTNSFNMPTATLVAFYGAVFSCRVVEADPKE